MRAGGVEVAEECAVPFCSFFGLGGFGRVRALGVDVVGDAELDGGFGVAVGVRGADGTFFGDGDHVREASCVAIDGGGGRKDNVGDIVAGHGAEEAYSSVDIDTVVLERDLARFTYCLIVGVWLS